MIMNPKNFFPSDDTIDESYGVNVVFHEDEDEDQGLGGRGEGGGHEKEGMIAHDDDDIVDDDEDEGMEADYDEVLKTAVSTESCADATGWGACGSPSLDSSPSLSPSPPRKMLMPMIGTAGTSWRPGVSMPTGSRENSTSSSRTTLSARRRLMKSWRF